MSNIEFVVYVVDDDEAIRKSMLRLFGHEGYTVEAFESGVDFLKNADLTVFGCVILDIAMPGMSGMEVHQELLELGCRIPVIFMTGHGDVPTSVSAIKNGAVEFLEKPFDIGLMLERVQEAMEIDAIRFDESQKNAETLSCFETLTPREKEVMTALVAGKADKSNKEIARDMGISHRTVEEYRARIFTKMGASSITHLAQQAKLCEIR